MRFNLEVKREKRFTRATLIDAAGNEIGARLCSLIYLPDTGLQPFEEFTIDARFDGEAVKLVIDQDPASDLCLTWDIGPMSAGSTVTVQPR